MSDGQTFYLLLAAFYLLECSKWLGENQLLWQGRWVRKHWALRAKRQLVELHGISKKIFATSLAPGVSFPIVCVAGSYDQSQPRARTMRCSVSRFLRVARPLRWMSTLLFLLCFVGYPALIILQKNEWLVIYAIANGYLLQLFIAIEYRRLQKFLKLPAGMGKAWLIEFFYNAFFPWHAMRAADRLAVSMTSRWHELPLLLAMRHMPACTSQLKHYWRQAHYAKNPIYQLAEMKAVLGCEKIDVSSWLDVELDGDAGPRYCPCCLTSYGEATETCADCDGVELRHV